MKIVGLYFIELFTFENSKVEYTIYDCVFQKENKRNQIDVVYV